MVPGELDFYDVIFFVYFARIFGQGWVSFSVYYTLVNGMTQPTVCLLLKYTGIFTSVLFFVSFSLPSTRVLKSLATDGIPLLALGLVVVKGFP